MARQTRVLDVTRMMGASQRMANVEQENADLKRQLQKMMEEHAAYKRTHEASGASAAPRQKKAPKPTKAEEACGGRKVLAMKAPDFKDYNTLLLELDKILRKFASRLDVIANLPGEAWASDMLDQACSTGLKNAAKQVDIMIADAKTLYRNHMGEMTNLSKAMGAMKAKVLLQAEMPIKEDMEALGLFTAKRPKMSNMEALVEMLTNMFTSMGLTLTLRKVGQEDRTMDLAVMGVYTSVDVTTIVVGIKFPIEGGRVDEAGGADPKFSLCCMARVVLSGYDTNIVKRSMENVIAYQCGTVEINKPTDMDEMAEPSVPVMLTTNDGRRAQSTAVVYSQTSDTLFRGANIRFDKTDSETCAYINMSSMGALQRMALKHMAPVKPPGLTPGNRTLRPTDPKTGGVDVVDVGKHSAETLRRNGAAHWTGIFCAGPNDETTVFVAAKTAMDQESADPDAMHRQYFHGMAVQAVVARVHADPKIVGDEPVTAVKVTVPGIVSVHNSGLEDPMSTACAPPIVRTVPNTWTPEENPRLVEVCKSASQIQIIGADVGTNMDHIWINPTSHALKTPVAEGDPTVAVLLSLHYSRLEPYQKGTLCSFMLAWGKRGVPRPVERSGAIAQIWETAVGLEKSVAASAKKLETVEAPTAASGGQTHEASQKRRADILAAKEAHSKDVTKYVEAAVQAAQFNRTRAEPPEDEEASGSKAPLQIRWTPEGVLQLKGPDAKKIANAPYPATGFQHALRTAFTFVEKSEIPVTRGSRDNKKKRSAAAAFAKDPAPAARPKEAKKTKKTTDEPVATVHFDNIPSAMLKESPVTLVRYMCLDTPTERSSFLEQRDLKGNRVAVTLITRIARFGVANTDEYERNYSLTTRDFIDRVSAEYKKTLRGEDEDESVDMDVDGAPAGTV
jgi:hypothetical protein